PYAGKTDLTTANMNLSAAYRLNQHFSFGLGFDAVYAKAKLERYAGESGAKLGVPADTQISHLKGDKWGFGWNAGILYEVDENNRYGFTYRSEVKVDFDGDYKSSLPSYLNPAQGATGLPWGTDGSTIPGSLSLHLPEMWEVSGYNKVAPQWAVHYSLAYTSWSQFKELKATGNNGQTLFQKDEGFKDAYRIAIGTTYFYDDNWTFRTGIAFDDSPVPAGTRSISIPDQDRAWISAGTSYAFNKDASVDVGVSYMHGSKVTINEGPYEFKSEGKAWLYGANFNYAF
ncbi:MAG: outer membrane protein transport protein, partial [Enterobacterales bacterium]|nr:outer membrane protein transport protein [Enterobacterales bacterium]